jgi:hypothetical protein
MEKKSIRENAVFGLRYSRQLIQGEASRLLHLVLSGKVEPIRVHLYIKAIEDAIKELKKSDKYNELLMESARNLGKDNHWYGARIETRTRTNWKYNDSKLNELEARKAEIDALIKARQKYLQSLKEVVMDPDTGEAVHPADGLGGTESVYVTFDKE